MRRLFTIAAAILVLGACAAIIAIYSGIYNVAALRQHTAVVYEVLQRAMVESIEQRAEEIVTPDLEDRELVRTGLAHYRRHCVQCHGAPGLAPEAFAMGMAPVPPRLVQTARERTPDEMFWAIKNGIKMTGMPAWEFRMADEDMWAIVAFLEQLPYLLPADYREMAGTAEAGGGPSGSPRDDARPAATGSTDSRPGDPERGKLALSQYACTTCHVIPGVVGPDARVGPSLEQMAVRNYIGGVVPNTSENMVRWILDPQEVDPLTAMPDMGVTPDDARDIAAYLDTLD